MIELVFVIVVIGILAAIIIPNTRTNPLQEAAIQLVSHIRYTQHLAMVDDKFDASDANWYKKRWQIAFVSVSGPTTIASNHEIAYTIYSDSSGESSGDANFNEIAKNPENANQVMTGGYSGTDNRLKINEPEFQGMKKLNLGKSYGITSLSFSNDCKVWGSHRIAFDYLGRPIKGKLGGASGGGNAEAYEDDNLIQNDCDITLKDGTNNIVIRIVPETGYVSII